MAYHCAGGAEYSTYIPIRGVSQYGISLCRGCWVQHLYSYKGSITIWHIIVPGVVCVPYSCKGSITIWHIIVPGVVYVSRIVEARIDRYVLFPRDSLFVFFEAGKDR
jgi:hypothetical protein